MTRLLGKELNMRKMLLSFKADVYKKVLSGEKTYEHRKVFLNEPIEAYLYVSAPVKAIVGIMHLDNRIDFRLHLSYHKRGNLANCSCKSYQ